MTSQPTNAKFGASTSVPKMQEQKQGADTKQGAETKQALLKDIRVKWGKFTELELSGLKTNDDLVGQVVTKYGLDKVQAQREVDTLRAGRNI